MLWFALYLYLESIPQVVTYQEPNILFLLREDRRESNALMATDIPIDNNFINILLNLTNYVFFCMLKNVKILSIQ